MVSIQPPLTQYVYWLIGNDWTLIDYDGDGIGETRGDRFGILRGDFGKSIKNKRPVMQQLLQRIPATLRLGVAALTIGFMMGVLLGVLAAVFHRTWVDQVIRIISVVGNAVPQFWLGLLLIIIFGVQLDLLPISGMQNITRRGGFDIADALRHMILPVFCFITELDRFSLALYADANTRGLAARLRSHRLRKRSE